MKIVAENLVKSYKRNTVVRGVSFEVSQGQIVGLLGPNGAGKTTTFYMIIGLVRPNGGKVLFDDHDVSHWPMFQRARQGVSYLPQEKSVFRRLTVRENIQLVMEMAGASKKHIREKTDELVTELHITHLLEKQAAVLSGGECRRVEIARALATDPKFILLDEPFTGIDPVTIEEIQAIIADLKKRNIGILITDHNVSATLNITDWNHILIEGKIEAEGTREDIIHNERVRKYYLGEGFPRGEEGNGSG